MLQLHVKARACATLRPALVQGARGVVVSVTGADGPRCVSGPTVDRCLTVTAKRALGSRALRPAGARRVAWRAATRCPASASS
jgi:hypothetical protein